MRLGLPNNYSERKAKSQLQFCSEKSMAGQSAPFQGNPIWQPLTVQAIDPYGNVSPQSIQILPQTNFDSYLAKINQSLAGVTGFNGQPANINGPLSVNSNPVTGVTNSSPPAADEALSYGTAQGLFSTFRQAIKTVSGSYSVQEGDGTILVDATAGPVVLVLPDATTVSGKIWIIMKIDASGNSVSLATVAGQTVSGPTTSTAAQWGKLWPQSTGQNFIVVNS